MYNILMVGQAIKETIIKETSFKFQSHSDIMIIIFRHVSDLFKAAREITDQRYPEICVGFGGLCGFDKNRYNCEAGFSPYQQLIDYVCEGINRQFLEDNIGHSIVHPTLTSKVHRCGRKYGVRNQYRLLYDGIHLSSTLNKDWARNIERFHKNNHAAN